MAFYAGWPKDWAVFNLVKEVWDANEGDLPYEDEAMRAHAKEMVFPIGNPNDGFAKYFTGKSYLAVEVPGTETSNEWCEPVTDEEYSVLK